MYIFQTPNKIINIIKIVLSNSLNSPQLQMSVRVSSPVSFKNSSSNIYIYLYYNYHRNSSLSKKTHLIAPSLHKPLFQYSYTANTHPATLARSSSLHCITKKENKNASERVDQPVVQRAICDSLARMPNAYIYTHTQTCAGQARERRKKMRRANERVYAAVNELAARVTLTPLKG